MYQGRTRIWRVIRTLTDHIQGIIWLALLRKEFGDLLAGCLKDLGFIPSYAESKIFMKENKETGLYEYVATYVDDLCLVMKEPEQFLKTLQSAPYKD